MEQRGPPRPPGQHTGHKVRRPRAARACDLCRVKKNKCDELYPCTYCKDRNAECVYRGQDASRRRYMPEYVRHLEELVSQLSAPNTTQGHQVEPHDPASQIDGVTPTSQNDRTHHEIELPRPSRMTRGGSASTLSVGSKQNAGQEVSGINHHTRNVEFYGRSSSVALLSQVQLSGGGPTTLRVGGADAAAIVSNLHNPAFTPPGGAHNYGQEDTSASALPSHYPQCRAFLHGFFSSIHYIHPIVDKSAFLQRCELLWSGKEEAPHDSSFTALYYSILSLGALVGLRDDEPIDGIENLQWSRKFFDEARWRCNKLGMVTDLDMVQCYIFMAKVCQNELNAHWSYMYIGLAVRTALAMGINREPGADTKKDTAQLRAESRTWWGLYSLETEISFAMGRPDTLGADPFHNRRFPLIRGDGAADLTDAELPDSFDAPYCVIIKPMVDLSRITRKLCLGIYLQDNTTTKAVALAFQIEREMEEWLDSLPKAIRPQPALTTQPETLKSVKEPQWVKRQKLVLLIRYFNLRILLFGSILLTSTPAERASIPQSVEAIQKCLEAAKQTIQVIYQVYQHHDFFHTWFYNTTYTVFAASIILVYVTQEAAEIEIASLLKLVGMAIEILETMDECVVAAKAAQMLRRASENAEKKCSPAAAESAVPVAHGTDPTVPWNQYWGPLNFVGGDMELDFNVFQLADLDWGNSLVPFGEQPEFQS